MKAEELRVKNLLQTKLDKKLTEVTNIFIFVDMANGGDKVHFHCYGYSQSDVEPIPLDKDWLRRFGFTKYPDYVEYHIPVETATGPKIVDYCLEDGSLFLNSDKIEVINVMEVHEMQNALWILNNFTDIKLTK